MAVATPEKSIDQVLTKEEKDLMLRLGWSVFDGKVTNGCMHPPIVSNYFDGC